MFYYYRFFFPRVAFFQALPNEKEGALSAAAGTQPLPAASVSREKNAFMASAAGKTVIIWQEKNRGKNGWLLFL